MDADGNIYFGSGSGKLFCLSSEGELRWTYKCIDEGRNDLNSSPALGEFGIIIAGESGSICFIPYDYPLTAAGKNDPRAAVGQGEELPDDGDFLVYTTPFGGVEAKDVIEIKRNEPLNFSLFVRKEGDTVHSALDAKHIIIEFSGEQKFQYNLGPRGSYLTIIPQEEWAGEELKLRIRTKYRADKKRFGLYFFGGKKSEYVEFDYTIKIEDTGALSLPLDDSSVFEIARLSCPYPTMLPSYNQIGLLYCRYCRAKW